VIRRPDSGVGYIGDRSPTGILTTRFASRDDDGRWTMLMSGAATAQRIPVSDDTDVFEDDGDALADARRKWPSGR